MLEANKREAAVRLKTVRGHLDGVIRMVEEDAYCVDLMKQISAIQSSLERVNRLVLRNHLETCFSQAVERGKGTQAITELMDAVKFDSILTGPKARLRGAAAGEPAKSRAKVRKAASGGGR